MKTSEMRREKYRVKVRGMVIPGQAKRFGEAAGGQVRHEVLVKTVMARNGVMPGLHHYYTAFGKKLGSLMGKHSGQTLEDEACMQFRKWSSRGLSEAVLDEVLKLYMPGLSCIIVACDYPAVGDVDKGVTYGFGAYVGTLDRGLPWTGQTTVYQAGDDGTYQKGHTTDRPIPGTRFTDNGDGTVTDNGTQLMWQQAGDGYVGDWSGAIAYAEALNLGGKTDWRLPNIKELHSIINCSKFNPVIDEPPFENTQLVRYWSSTTFEFNTEFAFALNFNYGSIDTRAKTTLTYYARCVRGGKP